MQFLHLTSNGQKASQYPQQILFTTMKLDSPLLTAAYAAAAFATGPMIVQWFFLPESGPFPSMQDNPANVKLFERIVHYGNIFAFATAAFYYATEKPKNFAKNNYGWLLVALLMQHVIEQAFHELGPATTDSILHENRIWTTYAVAVFHIYCFIYGYASTFLRIAAEPFFVYMAIVGGLMGTHASCVTNWTMGTYVALEGGMPYNVRLVNFILTLGVVGFVVKKYFEVHNEQAIKLKMV